MEKNNALVIRHLSNQTFVRLLNGEKFESREPVFFRPFMEIVYKLVSADQITICKRWF